jgi:hypothetical protein
MIRPASLRRFRDRDQVQPVLDSIECILDAQALVIVVLVRRTALRCIV